MISDERLRVSDVLPIDDQRELDDLLDQHNIDHTGIRDARLLSIMLRSSDGALYAGVHGHTWGGSCEIKTLWVAEQCRGQGLGGRLLKAVEEEVARRGCTQIVLSTHSFQAPAFYERHGFSRIATVADSPKGHAHILMVKRVAARPDAGVGPDAAAPSDRSPID